MTFSGRSRRRSSEVRRPLTRQKFQKLVLSVLSIFSLGCKRCPERRARYAMRARDEVTGTQMYCALYLLCNGTRVSGRVSSPPPPPPPPPPPHPTPQESPPPPLPPPATECRREWAHSRASTTLLPQGRSLSRASATQMCP